MLFFAHIGRLIAKRCRALLMSELVPRQLNSRHIT